MKVVSPELVQSWLNIIKNKSTSQLKDSIGSPRDVMSYVRVNNLT